MAHDVVFAGRKGATSASQVAWARAEGGNIAAVEKSKTTGIGKGGPVQGTASDVITCDDVVPKLMVPDVGMDASDRPMLGGGREGTAREP